MINHRPNKKNRHKPITSQPLKTINPNTGGIDIGSSEIYQSCRTSLSPCR